MKLAAGLHVCSQVDSLSLNCQLWLKSVSAHAIQLEMCQLISATTGISEGCWCSSLQLNDTTEIDCKSKPDCQCSIQKKHIEQRPEMSGYRMPQKFNLKSNVKRSTSSCMPSCSHKCVDIIGLE